MSVFEEKAEQLTSDIDSMIKQDRATRRVFLTFLFCQFITNNSGASTVEK